MDFYVFFKSHIVYSIKLSAASKFYLLAHYFGHRRTKSFTYNTVTLRKFKYFVLLTNVIFLDLGGRLLSSYTKLTMFILSLLLLLSLY